MVDKVIHDGKGRHSVNLLLAHDLHRGGREIVRVIDSRHPSLCCIRSSRLTRAVHTHKRARAIGLGDRRRKLRLGVLVRRRKVVAVEMVWSRLVNFVKSALPALLTHHRDDLVGRVRIVSVGEHLLRRVESDGVFMAAQDVDRVCTKRACAGQESGRC